MNQNSNSTNLYKAFLRWIWTISTYLLLGIAIILSIIPFILWGFFHAIQSGRGLWFGIQSGALMGVFWASKFIVGSSTKIYNSLFLGIQFSENAEFPKINPEFLIIGHRGDPYNAPENTIRAFRKALQNGANALEIDLCLSKDGHVVVWHDWDPSAAVAKFRASGLEVNQGYRPYYPDNEFLRPVPELTFDELRTHYGLSPNHLGPFSFRKGKPQIVSFHDFMAWAIQQKSLNTIFLDIKIPEGQAEWADLMLPKIQAEIDEFQAHFQCVLMSPYKDIFDKLRQISPSIPACLDKEVIAAVFSATEAEAATFGAMRSAEIEKVPFASIGRPTFLTLAPWEVYEGILRLDLSYRNEKQLTTKLIAWTIDEPAEMQALIKMGVDGILTNRPAILAKRILRRETSEIIKTLPSRKQSHWGRSS